MPQLPLPDDLPVLLPADAWLLESLLITAFVAHLALVSVAVGGSLLGLGLQIRGLRQPDFARLARPFAAAVAVSRGLALAAGVVPLLLLDVLYRMHLRTASSLTATAWLIAGPALALACLLLFWHGRTWHLWPARRLRHLGLQAAAVVLLLGAMLVFVVNAVLMAAPEQWTAQRGFLAAITLPGVWPRYAQFLCWSLIAAGLFGAWRASRLVASAGGLERLTVPAVRRLFYAVAFGGGLMQLGLGPAALWSSPASGVQAPAIVPVASSALLVLLALCWLWMELQRHAAGRGHARIVGAMGLALACTALGRHAQRYLALGEHRARIEEASRQWLDAVAQAAFDEQLAKERAAAGVSEGQHLFQSNCAACHALDRKVVGPALIEIAQIYAGNLDGLVQWARQPGKKRADAPQMPPFAAVGEERLRKIGEYVLQVGGAK